MMKRRHKMPPRRPGVHGYVRAADDSMAAAGLRNGDLAIIKLGRAPKHGKMAAVFTATGQVVVRRVFYSKRGTLRLEAADPNIPPVLYAPAAIFILGRLRRIVAGGTPGSEARHVETEAAPPTDHGGRVAELREMLRDRYAPEDEGARFAILRELDDLERETDALFGKWAEVVGGAG